jgi:hypothetical protein
MPKSNSSEDKYGFELPSSVFCPTETDMMPDMLANSQKVLI